jgi:hypothetical protein
MWTHRHGLDERRKPEVGEGRQLRQLVDGGRLLRERLDDRPVDLLLEVRLAAMEARLERDAVRGRDKREAGLPSEVRAASSRAPATCCGLKSMPQNLPRGFDPARTVVLRP